MSSLSHHSCHKTRYIPTLSGHSPHLEKQLPWHFHSTGIKVSKNILCVRHVYHCEDGRRQERGVGWELGVMWGGGDFESERIGGRISSTCWKMSCKSLGKGKRQDISWPKCEKMFYCNTRDPCCLTPLPLSLSLLFFPSIIYPSLLYPSLLYPLYFISLPSLSVLPYPSLLSALFPLSSLSLLFLYPCLFSHSLLNPDALIPTHSPFWASLYFILRLSNSCSKDRLGWDR